MPSYIYRLLRATQPHWPLVRRIEREFERDQWGTVQEVQAVAWHKLKALLDHAYVHVPYYQQQFRALGLTPHDIQTPEDYRHLPLLTKEDIRQHTEALIADTTTKAHLRRVVTSGSTGEPFATYHDRLYEAANAAAFARSRRWFGWEFGDKIAWVWGRRQEIPQTYKEHFINHLKQERWFDSFHPTVERLATFVAELRHWKPALVAGYTNVIYLLAQYLEREGITDIHPRMIETTGMQLWPHEREQIERSFGCPVSDRYGSHESGSVVASECPAGRRHLFQDFCYVEVLHNDVLAHEGVPGEIITTPLYAYGMPLLRFRVGDVGIVDTQHVCACGRSLPLLQDIQGRVASIFTLPSGKLLYGGIFRNMAFKDITTFKKIREHQYARDRIEIMVEKGPGFDESMIPLVRERCLALLGEPVTLTITVVDEIPPTASGKHLVTVSDVPVQLN